MANEHVLSPERDRLAAVVGALGDGVVDLDGDGRVRLANPEAARLLGLPQDTLIGAVLAELLAIEDLDEQSASHTDVLIGSALTDGRTIRREEARFVSESGAAFIASFVLSPLDGEQRGAVLVFRDVTDGWLALRVNESLHAVGRVVVAGELSSVPGLVAAEAGAIFGSEGIVVRFEADGATVLGCVGRHSKVGDVLPTVGSGALARVRESSAPARIDDYAALPPDSPVRAHALGLGYTATAAAPVHVSGRLWGAILVTTRRREGLAPGAELALGDFAELVGQGIANGEARAELVALANSDPLTGLANHRVLQERLHRDAERARADGEGLALAILDLDHFKAVNDRHGHQAGDRVLRIVARRLVELAGPDDLVGRVGGEEFAWVMPGATGDEAADLLERARATIAAEEIAPAGRITVSAGLCDLTAARGADELYRYADGALYWAKRHGRDRVVRYSREVVEVLSDRERADRLGRQQALQSIRVLARAVDAKDHSTQEHSERVADLAVQIGTVLGWPAPRLAQLREAGLVHDVGKIAIPDAILLKPAALDSAERRRIEQHAAIGAEMVADVLTRTQVAWVRSHHERWSGGGYPDNLGGEAIPDGARILALADSWDVMTSDRPYRSGMSAEAALAECRRCAGGQFWPEAVEALARLATLGALLRTGSG